MSNEKYDKWTKLRMSKRVVLQKMNEYFYWKVFFEV